MTVTLTGFNSTAGDLGTAITHTVTIKDTPLVVGFQSITSRRIEGTAIVIAFTAQLPSGITPTFTLTGFNGNVVLGTNTVHTLTMEDEDERSLARLVISLNWDAGNGTMGDVDMDLLVWYQSAPGAYTLKFIGDNVGQVAESISVPANEADGKWGISYVYYSGTSNNLQVTASFRSYKGNINQVSNRATSTATYSLVNKNAWDVTQQYRIEQFYDKTLANYNNLTAISVPTSRSREQGPQFIIDKSVLESKKLSRKVQ